MNKKNGLFIFTILFLSFCSFSARAQNSIVDFSKLAEKALPTVVQINDYDKESGSGFIISEDGYIVTNKHVIKDLKSIEILDYSDNLYSAELIASDNETDLALLKIEPTTPLAFASFGNSDNTKIGEWVIAIGNPLGLGTSVTKGIISAKSRDISENDYDDFIQTDAYINQGNSGGPLFDMSGNVIGINSILFAKNGKNIGIGFAIPSNVASWVIDELKENKVVNRGYIGAKFFNSDNGVTISAFMEVSPARESGLQIGDLILSVDEINLKTNKDMIKTITRKRSGEIILFEVSRNGKIEKISTNVEYQTISKAPIMIESNDILDIQEFGIKVHQQGENFIIVDVTPYSPAENIGLEVGVSILKIDKQDIFNLEDFTNVIYRAKREDNRPIELLINHNDNISSIKIRVKQND